MIVTEILGNRADLSEGHLASLAEDHVLLDNLSVVKRIQRLTTQSGRELGLRLPPSVRELRDGDILFASDDELITVKVQPTDVLVIRSGSIHEMAVVAHTLGNRHLQAQFFGPESEYGQAVMVVQYDHTVEDYLQHVGVAHTRESRVMPTAFRHAEHSH